MHRGPGRHWPYLHGAWHLVRKRVFLQITPPMTYCTTRALLRAVGRATRVQESCLRVKGVSPRRVAFELSVSDE